MTFRERHMPKTIDDLVFRDQRVAKIIREYADGARSNHLLLYGPPGSGKSQAARILVDTLCPGTAGSYANEHINPKNFGKGGFERITNQWSAQMGLGGAKRGFVIIDEVDWFATKMMHELRGFMDDTHVGTIICTTNHLTELDDPLQSRFLKLHIEWPTADDWLPRAKAIMAAEGYDVTTDEMRLLLKGFHGDARSLCDWLEECILNLSSSLPPSCHEPKPKTPNLTVIEGGAERTE